MDQKNKTVKLPGFYIALCVCVVAIGTAGFIAQNMESESTNAITEVMETETPMPTDNVESAAQIVVTEPPVETEPVIDSEPALDTAAIEDYTYDNPDLAAAAISVNAEESSLLSSPLPDMSVLYGFSGDELLYNDVMGDWRVHSGIDIAANIGASVCSAADGEVVSVTKGACGNEVRISHTNNIETVYAQLNDICVNEGDHVNEGSVIGIIAESIGETTREPHLHYEIYKDGKAQNPEEF